jgi:hypothetical protein
MRPLSSTLTAAVNAKTRRPAISLTAEDHINHLAQVIAAANSDGYNDLCIADDGSIIRVRVTRGDNAFQQSFQWQRITDPTSGSQWTTWNTFGGGSGNIFQDGGCAISKDQGTMNAYCQQGTGGNALWNWYSNDGGQTWSGPDAILSPPGSALIKGISSASNADVFFQYDVSGGDNIGCSFWNGTAWSALQAWTLSPASSAQGLAVYWTGSLYYIVYSDGYALHLVTANSNGTIWTALQDIVPATSTAIERISPRLSFFDNLYQLSCVEADAGFLTGSVYSYPRIRQSQDLIHWSGGYILHDMSCTYGAAILKCTPPGASRARYIAASMPSVSLGTDFQTSDSTQYIDLSAYVLEYMRTDEVGKPSKLTVVLDNAASSLMPYVATYGTTYQPIGLNTLLVLSEGYRTGTPPTTVETVVVAKYHIRQIIFERAPGKSQLRLEAEDLLCLLDQANRYQVTYINQQLSWMITEICARAGLLSLSLPTTAQMSTSIPTFVLHAGQRYRLALDELCRIGWLEYFLDQNETMQFRELSSSDPSVWTYQPEIETLTIGSDALRGNHVLVSGKPPAGGPLGAITSGESYDDVHMHTTGLERLVMSADSKLTTSALCAASAAFILAQQQRDQMAHSIEVPANPALQPLDVITLNDISSGASGTGLVTTARIQKNEIHFIAQKAMYESIIHLEGI